MAGRRGARTGRGWDAAPSRPGGGGRRRAASARSGAHDETLPGSSDPEPFGRSARRPGGDRSGGADRSDGSVMPGDGAYPPRDEVEVAREICLRQLAVRPRTRAELATALRRRGISVQVAEQVLNRYDEVGMIDDAAFARAWVTSRHAGRGLARRALAVELRQRGVDAEIVREALSELDEETETATARELAARKLRSAVGPPEAVFRRVVGMLARKGYSPGVAIRVVKEALAARDAEAAEFAEQIDADALADAELESSADPRLER